MSQPLPVLTVQAGLPTSPVEDLLQDATQPKKGKTVLYLRSTATWVHHRLFACTVYPPRASVSLWGDGN